MLEERIGGQTRVQYVWSPVYVDALVLRDRDTSGDGTLDERLWVVQDANYNVTALFDNAGNVVERYVYDPFGQVTVLDANWSERAAGSQFGWLHLHQGGRLDATSGLYHFRHRDYSPTLGRWTSLDPLRYDAGDVNLYRALGNMPTGRTDPTGLDWVWPWDPRADWGDWRLGEFFRDVARMPFAPRIGGRTPGYIDLNITVPIPGFWKPGAPRPNMPIPFPINSFGVKIGDGPPGPIPWLPGVHPYVGLAAPGVSIRWDPGQEVHPGVWMGGGGFYYVGGKGGIRLPPPGQAGRREFYGEIGFGTPHVAGGIWYIF